jgi:hypothetical protein
MRRPLPFAAALLACIASTASAQQFNTSDGTTYLTSDSAYQVRWDSATDSLVFRGAAPGTAGGAITWQNRVVIGQNGVAIGSGVNASGSRSFAWGEGEASATNSTSWGDETAASGVNSTTWGAEATASGESSTAWGETTASDGWVGTAWGYQANAQGDVSTAWGHGSHAGSYAETSLGRFPLNTPGTAGSWVATDTLFEVGNGTTNLARANAITLLKNGNMIVGNGTPQSRLHVPDGGYLQAEDNNAGAPPAGDCDADAERGRISIDTSNNRLYVCNGAARGWDYATLTD